MDGGLFLCYGYKVEYYKVALYLSSVRIIVCIRQALERYLQNLFRARFLKSRKEFIYMAELENQSPSSCSGNCGSCGGCH